MSNIFNMLSCLAVGLTKLSLLWFSRRMVGRALSGAYRVYFAVLAILASIVLVSTIIFIMVTALGCRYVEISYKGK